MRLIDADALMDYCQNQRSKTISCNDIARFPTAYDVDKVCEEIDRYSVDNTDWSYSTNPKLASYYLLRTKDAIDIVRRGVINEV